MRIPISKARWPLMSSTLPQTSRLILPKLNYNTRLIRWRKRFWCSQKHLIKTIWMPQLKWRKAWRITKSLIWENNFRLAPRTCMSRLSSSPQLLNTTTSKIFSPRFRTHRITWIKILRIPCLWTSSLSQPPRWGRPLTRTMALPGPIPAKTRSDI